MDKRATVRPVRASYSIEQVENGWTVSTNDGTVFVFADSKELVVWFCMVVGGTVRTETFRTGRRGITDTETGKGLRLVRENDIRFLQSRSQRATGETSNVSPQWTIATFSMQDKKESSIETKTVHAGEPSPRINGAVVMPIFQSATFESTGERPYDDIRYIRLNNTPNHKALAEKLAKLENAEAALVTSSGMAAITTTLLALLSTGDHLLVQDCLYGGTHDFVTKDLRDFGISYDFINGNKPEDWKRKLKTNTKAIYVETIANPLMGVPHLEDVVEFASAKGIVSVIDNTFASPINFRPPELGFDLSLHSATKYLNGHSDIVAGAVIGSRDLVKKITHRLNHLGGSLDPHAAFLLHRGMKTLALRVKHQK